MAAARPVQQRKVQPLTWLGRPWHDRAWLHPLYGTASVYVAGSVVEAMDRWSATPAWQLVGGSVLAGLCTAAGGLLSAAGHRFTGWARGYFTAAGLAAGTWLTGVAATSPYQGWALLSAAAAAVLFTGAYPALRNAQLHHEQWWRTHHHPSAAGPALPPAESPSRNPEAAKWEQLLATVGAPGLKFLDRVPTRAGFSLLMRLPADGRIKFSTLNLLAERIEIAAGLAEGCVTFERATSEDGRTLARDIWVHFDVEDVLTKTLPMPDEHGPLSINEAFAIGKYADGEPIYLKLREVAALIVGVRGRGKTNLLNVIIYQLSRCVDVTIWMIDLKGGRAVKPWLGAWFDDEAARPVLDWVATNRFEAHRMLVGALALITQRGQSGVGGSKIRPSRELPAVIVICDEVAALVGVRSGPKSAQDGQGETSRTLANILTTCIQLGRSEAVDFVLATQRSTVTMIGNGDLKSQCELRIGLGVSTPQDARSVFEGNAVAARLLSKLKDKATRGAVLVQDGDGARIAPGKARFFGDHEEMERRAREAAIQHANYPAPLDERGQAAVDAAVRALGDGTAGYKDRWSDERAAHLYGDDARGDHTPPAAAPVSVVPAAGQPAVRQSTFYPRRDKPTPPPVDPFAQEWAAIVNAFEGDTAPEVEYAAAEADEPDEVNRRKRMIQIIDEAGPAGTMPSEVLARMVREKTAWKQRTSMYPALKKALADGDIVQPAGDRGRYYTPRHAG